ncbi:hypothetical protein D9758_012071 [Tetrapyrgos nigripes]|uniref:Uncharacterized protein n=1 Tax=Tetrapyrgos nigripes TaxID=182062 RepID=A0A8H5FJL5_9AGAR|nr:hypothetical protein D9758_012071 [Tetrapyrgos nigripes]
MHRYNTVWYPYYLSNMANRYRRLLELYPETHPPTLQCGLNSTSQHALKTAWIAAAHYLASNTTGDTTSSTAKEVFQAFSGHILCKDCLEERKKAIREVVVQWDEIVLLPSVMVRLLVTIGPEVARIEL